MDVAIQKNDVVLLGKSLDGRHAAQVSGRVGVAGRLSDKGGQALLQHPMVAAGAIRDAGPAGAGTPFPQSLDSGFHHLGMKTQPQIIVARKHHHLLPLQPGPRPVLAFEMLVIGRVTQPQLGVRTVVDPVA